MSRLSPLLLLSLVVLGCDRTEPPKEKPAKEKPTKKTASEPDGTSKPGSDEISDEQRALMKRYLEAAAGNGGSAPMSEEAKRDEARRRKRCDAACSHFGDDDGPRCTELCVVGFFDETTTECVRKLPRYEEIMSCMR